MSLFHRFWLGPGRAPAACLLAASLWLGCGSTPSTGAPGVAPPSGLPSTVTATAAAADVSPNYLWSFDTLQLLVDANLVVQDASSGNIRLQLANKNSPPGEEWKTFEVTDPCCRNYTYTELDTLYSTASQAATGPIGGPADLVLSWRLFGLLGKTLPTKRALIVQRKGGSGRAAYALFEFVFPGPQ